MPTLWLSSRSTIVDDNGGNGAGGVGSGAGVTTGSEGGGGGGGGVSVTGGGMAVEGGAMEIPPEPNSRLPRTHPLSKIPANIATATGIQRFGALM